MFVWTKACVFVSKWVLVLFDDGRECVTIQTWATAPFFSSKVTQASTWFFLNPLHFFLFSAVFWLSLPLSLSGAGNQIKVFFVSVVFNFLFLSFSLNIFQTDPLFLAPIQTQLSQISLIVKSEIFLISLTMAISSLWLRIKADLSFVATLSNSFKAEPTIVVSFLFHPRQLFCW